MNETYEELAGSRWATSTLADLACAHAWKLIDVSDEAAFDFYESIEDQTEVRHLACSALSEAGYTLNDVNDWKS